MDNFIGDLIKKHRTDLGLSLCALSKLSGISKGQIWDLEQGKSRNPTVNTIKKLAKCLDISVHCFIED